MWVGCDAQRAVPNHSMFALFSLYPFPPSSRNFVFAYGLYFSTGPASIIPCHAVVGQSWNSHSGGNSFLVQLELAVHVEDSFYKVRIAAPTTTLLPR